MQTAGTHCYSRLGGCRPGPDWYGESRPHQAIASRYTDCAMPGGCEKSYVTNFKQRKFNEVRVRVKTLPVCRDIYTTLLRDIYTTLLRHPTVFCSWSALINKVSCCYRHFKLAANQSINHLTQYRSQLTRSTKIHGSLTISLKFIEVTAANPRHKDQHALAGARASPWHAMECWVRYWP
jgi:hypothetical protein